MCKVKPLGSRILVKRDKKLKSKSGILLPESSQEAPKEAVVIAVGQGHILEDGSTEPLDIKVGDNILFKSYAGTEVPSDGEGEYLIMNQDDILAVIVNS
ncbi:co-chaperone GroES [Candidatus Aerophobetes bacterium]|uniref:Co-chaperonin GroES n=1 Tax=Aerophobetes bacterium TaxID=2030807 RepID=A0A2A4X070_UNCAE|nr:MAG: co-chaperone GroES [Candidatus Aerophobetes bacterium]